MHSLRAKIGQMFVVGCRGETLAREEQLLFEQCGFGGFILFKDNCREARQILALCRSLWPCAGEMPPFLAIDHEGGRVHRLPEPFTRFPSAAWIGEKRDRNLAYRLGKAAAEELALAGFNLNFAPVLDVHSNPQNPIIGDRSFGSDPETVIELASAWAQGLRDGGVIPCGKHFPGHGDTDQDSHLDLPMVEKPMAQLEALELAPFARACRAGIEALMTAHVRYAAWDGKFPATLSEPVVTGLLRHQLGYDGVVFSDDMEMKAIADHFSLQEAVFLGVRAGIDVFLFCHDLARAVEAWEWLSAEAEKDAALRAQVENSFRRIAALKGRYLKTFTGAAQDEIESRLRRLGD
ncbi:MAG TPA: beta-N-acetylhexosaminidase [Methyloceanibacter sp.]|nr:beta-N-acetylhexosaminidase [Methyloceanibacter sp.]